MNKMDEIDYVFIKFAYPDNTAWGNLTPFFEKYVQIWGFYVKRYLI